MIIEGKKRCINCFAQLSDDGTPCSCGFNEAGYVKEEHCLPPGTMLNGMYCIGRVIGEGGFGITYSGYDVNLELRVAIKEFFLNGYNTRNTVISNDLNSSYGSTKETFEQYREKFINEARTLAKFNNEPGIVSVMNFFKLNNTAYIIMEYLDGMNMKEYVKANGTLSGDDTVKIFLPIVQALDKVHKKDLIHRDISPDNIIFTKDGRVKLLDFGATREVAKENKSLSVILKHGFSPMEQYQSHGVQGPWTDVYALCATMYKCITGKTPPEATDRAMGTIPVPPCELSSNCSKSISDVIMKGMELGVNNRYQSMKELEDALIAAKDAKDVPVIGIDMAALDNNKTVFAADINERAFAGNTSQMSTPQVSTPVMSTPQVSTPVMSTPQVSTPVMSTPQVSTPVAGQYQNTDSQPYVDNQPMQQQPVINIGYQNGTPTKKNKIIPILIASLVAIVALLVVSVTFLGGSDSSDATDRTQKKTTKSETNTSDGGFWDGNSSTEVATEDTGKKNTDKKSTDKKNTTKEDTTEVVTTEVYDGPVELNVWSFTDEIPVIIQKYIDRHPGCNITLNSTIIPTTDGAYQPALDQALAAGGLDAPDIYAAEAAFILKYTQGDAYQFAMPYENLGIDVKNKIKKADIAQYTVDIGTNPEGKVVGLGYQATGGAFIYRRSIANDTWGTDDPAFVADKIGAGSGKWDQFYNAAVELNSKGYAILSSEGDMWHAVENSSAKGWVVNNKLNIDPARAAFLDHAKLLYDNGFCNYSQDWTDQWFADMRGEGDYYGGKQVLGFFGPAWLINYTLAPNCGGERLGEGTYGDWAVCAPPVGFFWGGTWIMANNQAPKEKLNAIRDIIEWITLDCTEDGLQYLWANGLMNGGGGTKDCVASGTVMSMSDGRLDFLGGQDMYDALVPANQYATGKNITQYDEVINSVWRDCVRQYATGTISRDEAIAMFKREVYERTGLK